MKPSRARRTQAVKAAWRVLYDRKGAVYDDSLNPFEDERRRRIFEKYYHQYHANYWFYEDYYSW